MITELTEEQKLKFPIYVDKWIKIGKCTEPADRKKSEDAIREVYEYGNQEPPKRIIWAGSPVSMCIIYSLLVNDYIDDKDLDTIGSLSLEEIEDRYIPSKSRKPRSLVKRIINIIKKIKKSVFKNKLKQSMKDACGMFCYGYHDADFLSFYDYMRNELGLIEQTDKLQGLHNLSHHCGWILPTVDVCFASERYSICKTDDRNMLHCEDGPAIKYPDGYSVFAIHGVRIPEFVVMNPERITTDDISGQENVEIRRIMIDKYGLDRYISDSGAMLIHSDRWGELYKKEQKDDEPLVMVKVINSTIEPDGSRKPYFIRVPPGIETACEAVAWTFGQNKDGSWDNDLGAVDEDGAHYGEYNPSVET